MSLKLRLFLVTEDGGYSHEKVKHLQGNIFKVSIPDFDQIFFFALLPTRMKIRRILAANIHKQQQQKCLNF